MKFIFIFKLLITVKHQKNIYKMNTTQYPNNESSQNQYREERYNKNDQRPHKDGYHEERYNRNEQRPNREEYHEERYNRNDQCPHRNHHEEERYRNEQKIMEEKRVIRELRKKEYEDLDPETRERYEEIDRYMEMFHSPDRKLLKGEFILTAEQRRILFSTL